MNWYKKATVYGIGPVYHGTDAIFDEYDPMESGLSSDHQTAQLGMFFTNDMGEAENYGGNVISAMISVNNPYKTSWEEIREEDGWGLQQRLKSEGYDGVMISGNGPNWWVVFDKSQINRIG